MFLRSGLVMAILVLGGFGVSIQAAVNLSVHKQLHAHSQAITLAAPATPTPAAKPPTPTAKPAPTKAPARRIAYAPKPLPPVTPAPDSVVSHLVPVAPASTPSPTTTPSPTGTPTPGLGQGTTTPAATAYYSTNWAGYMSPAGNFTGISGSWTVPHAGGNGISESGDAAWIGIGGVTGSDLIQVGTDDTVTKDGQASTIAFYEMLPAPETPIPAMSVAAGDVMSAEIRLISGSQWQISINDVTQHETFSITVTYASTQSSAEWIQEDPSYAAGSLVPFDVFGSVSFTDSLATSNGVSQNLIDSGAQKIILINRRGRALATPSAIGGDGGSFTVTGG
jgi:hypothetical protein